VCSAGGHLLELHELQELVWSNFDRSWVTLRKIDSEVLLRGEKVYFAFGPTNRNYFNLIRNFFYAIYVLTKEHPTCVVSSGAGIAIPFLYFGRLMGARTIYLESFARWSKLSLTGRVVYPIVHDFLVQSPEIAARLPKAVFRGSLF
jgi:beta-1,4-N-acetylglucosaminyltransferase